MWSFQCHSQNWDDGDIGEEEGNDFFLFTFFFKKKKCQQNFFFCFYIIFLFDIPNISICGEHSTINQWKWYTQPTSSVSLHESNEKYRRSVKMGGNKNTIAKQLPLSWMSLHPFQLTISQAFHHPKTKKQTKKEGLENLRFVKAQELNPPPPFFFFFSF